MGARAGAARIISDSIGEPAPARRSVLCMSSVSCASACRSRQPGAAGGAGAEVDEPEQARADGELAWPVDSIDEATAINPIF